MRLKNVPGSKEYIAESDFVIHDEKEQKGRLLEYFSNDNPIHIEIGMGKGQFIYEMAKNNPFINYIGIERYSSVLIRAVQKKEELDLPNLTFVLMDATEITEVFETGEVEKIYLNFSDPWPKRAHRKRRLTHEVFLNLYKEILSENGEIFLRTDAASLMEFSLVSMTNCDFSLEEVSFDFHESPYFDYITTDYEDKKSKNGPIYYARFILKK